MDERTYQIEDEVEEHHWWFVARRRLLARIIRSCAIPSDAPTLDIGTSTGTNLRLLQSLGYRETVGLDMHPAAIRYCARKGLGRVELGDVCALPFASETFALVLATDIIEHVDDDVLALREIGRVLRPGGTALITVPAFPSLWGVNDEVGHHKRRYRRAELHSRLQASGLACRDLFYFNFILFLPIWLARQVIHLFGLQVQNENQVNTHFLNRILTLVFGLDVALARTVRAPFGVSILAIAEKPASRQPTGTATTKNPGEHHDAR